MIKNKSAGKIISKSEIVCDSILSRTLGLMFKPKTNLLMILPEETKACLHMFFVFYPIDVLVLDKNKKIVQIKRNFEPFTFWNSDKKGRYIIELAFSSEYKEGDKLEF